MALKKQSAKNIQVLNSWGGVLEKLCALCSSSYMESSNYSNCSCEKHLHQGLPFSLASHLKGVNGNNRRRVRVGE